jgi:pimeloyl-ACP methyl ester carboxylesterase
VRADMLLVLAQLGIDRAHFIGTSRGGLHVMALAAEHRDLVAGAVLNDIGPVLEPAGLARIKGYIGRAVAPVSLAEAVRLMKLGDAAAGFDGLDADEWRHFAATTFGSDESDLRLRYDPQLARTLDGFDLTKPLPDSWALFDQLRPAPILTIRGANSDLLSAETLDAMTRRWPGNRALVVPGQAHAPLLADDVTIAAIAGFLADADAG